MTWLETHPLAKRLNGTPRVASAPNVPLTSLVVLVSFRATEGHHESVEVISPRTVSTLLHRPDTTYKDDFVPMYVRTEVLRTATAQKKIAK